MTTRAKTKSDLDRLEAMRLARDRAAAARIGRDDDVVNLVSSSGSGEEEDVAAAPRARAAHSRSRPPPPPHRAPEPGDADDLQRHLRELEKQLERVRVAKRIDALEDKILSETQALADAGDRRHAAANRSKIFSAFARDLSDHVCQALGGGGGSRSDLLLNAVSSHRRPTLLRIAPSDVFVDDDTDDEDDDGAS